MTAIDKTRYLRIFCFFSLAAFAWGVPAAAESARADGGAVLFDMDSLIGADPYDSATLEGRFAAALESRKAGGTPSADPTAPATGFALARALENSRRTAEARRALEKTVSLLSARGTSDALGATLAAHAYLELIVDGPSWVRYNPALEKAMAAMEKEGAPERDVAFVAAKRLALFPPEIGGDRERSLDLFASIGETKAPFEFAVRYAAALISAGERERGRAVLERRAAEEPRDAAAAALLDRLRVEEEGASVRSIVLPKGLRTAPDRIAKAVQLRPGDTLSADAVDADLRRLAGLSSVVGTDVRYRYDGAANEADVEYFVAEGASRSLAFFLSSVLHAGPHESGYLYPDDSEVEAALIYGDSNFFGRAWNFELIFAAVYNKVELSKEGIGGTPFGVRFGAEGKLLSIEELKFYDRHRYLEEERELSSRYLTGGATVEYLSPIGVRPFAEYAVRKDWYAREGDTPDSFVLPSDILHTARIGLELDMEGRRGPAGLVPVGFRIGTAITYDYFQGFSGWGSPAFWNTAPENDLGTLTVSAEVRYGAVFAERCNASVALGAYGGTNYYTRTYHRLGGSAGPMDSSLQFLRGYREDEFLARSAWVGHLDAGYELSPDRLHVGLFSDLAGILPAPGEIRSWRPLATGGLGVAAVLPWEIQLYAEYAHGFLDLTGSMDHGHDTLSLIMLRSFSW